MKDKIYMQKIEDKLEILESKLNSLKSSFTNVDTKANRIFEDDLMNLETLRTALSKDVKGYDENDEESASNVEDSLSRYEKKLYTLLDKYEKNTTKR
jgi:hypothetical protein